MTDAPKGTKPKSRSLFHYTSGAGLLGIIQSQSLFASHSEFSNDSSECKLILPVVQEVIRAEYERMVPELVKIGIFKPELLTELGPSGFALEAEHSVKAMLSAANNTAPYFITSFCIHAPGTDAYENGLLSQWRSYARGGFAIEFDEHGIDELNRIETKHWRYAGIITNTVEYENHVKKIEPDKYKGLAGTLLKSLLGVKDNALDSILGTAPINEYAHNFLATAPFLKHRGFAEESEYRIVALCNRPSRKEPNDERPAKQILFRSQNSNPAPYIALYKDVKKKLPIKSIIIGPHANQENQRAVVEILLEQHELEATVRVSETPFRD